MSLSAVHDLMMLPPSILFQSQEKEEVVLVSFACEPKLQPTTSF